MTSRPVCRSSVCAVTMSQTTRSASAAANAITEAQATPTIPATAAPQRTPGTAPAASSPTTSSSARASSTCTWTMVTWWPSSTRFQPTTPRATAQPTASSRRSSRTTELVARKVVVTRLACPTTAPDRRRVQSAGRDTLRGGEGGRPVREAAAQSSVPDGTKRAAWASACRRWSHDDRSVRHVCSSGGTVPRTGGRRELSLGHTPLSAAVLVLRTLLGLRPRAV